MVNKTEKRKIGDLGEGISCNYLEDKGYKIIERNYWKPWGEIDIVAERKGITHFIEVKTVQMQNELRIYAEQTQKDVTRGTFDNVPRVTDSYNPAENIHPQKLKRLSKVIQTYILSHNIENDWEFSATIVYLDVKDKKAKINHIKDIVLT